ncbi:MAG: EI24 domain-containing protein [Candidatus Saccharibacteria bacterium]|nr:EI24 domain-containing protein [Rhodoferax sp.]
MNPLIDAFWRAAAYCLRPGVIVLSFLPLLLICVASLALGYFFWDNALDLVRVVLESSDFVNHGWAWLDRMGLGRIKTVLAPLVVIFAVTPLVVIVCLLVVALMMTPWLVRLVAQRRFPQLQALGTDSFVGGLMWSLASAALAVIATIISIPLWFIPPLVLILPPLIWGWLTYRVMAFDVLAEYATDDERRLLLRRHRSVLLSMGVMTGFLGAAPGLLWASVALFAAMFVILLPLALWIYTLVFAFSSLWFSHYCLAALSDLRVKAARAVSVVDIELPSTEAPVTTDMRELRGTAL